MVTKQVLVSVLRPQVAMMYVEVVLSQSNFMMVMNSCLFDCWKRRLSKSYKLQRASLFDLKKTISDKMGRGAAWWKAMKLDKGDHVVAALVVPKRKSTHFSLLAVTDMANELRLENTKFRNEVVLVSRPQT